MAFQDTTLTWSTWTATLRRIAREQRAGTWYLQLGDVTLIPVLQTMTQQLFPTRSIRYHKGHGEEFLVEFLPESA